MQNKMYGLLIICLLFLTGCAGPKIAANLLDQAPKNTSSLKNESVVIKISINPKIHNWETIDHSVKESLDLALNNANIFCSKEKTDTCGEYCQKCK